MGVSQLLVFTLDAPRYALNLELVERVIRAAEITPLPKAPDWVLGVLNVHGQVLPVVDLRPRLNLPPRKMDPDHRFILARSGPRLVALLVDAVDGVHQTTEGETEDAQRFLPAAEYIHGIAQMQDHLVLICDLAQLLPFDGDPTSAAWLTETSAPSMPGDESIQWTPQATAARVGM